MSHPPPSGPPLNPYAVYEQQQAYLAQNPGAQQAPVPHAPPPAPGYMANGFPVPPQFASGRAQGQAERNIGKTLGFRFIVGTIAGVFTLGLLFAIGGVIALVSH